jgi:hypothetical protein
MIAIALLLIVPVQREMRMAVLPAMSAMSTILQKFGSPLTLEEITIVPETLILKSYGIRLVPLSDKNVMAPKISTAPTLFKWVKIGAVVGSVLPNA